MPGAHYRYQSVECQKAHWKHHKIACAAATKERRDLEERLKPSGKFPHAYTDFIKWCDYYATPMKNCAVAALNLPRYPHDEKNGLLNIVISYKDDWAGYPPHKRFIVEIVAFPRRSSDGQIPPDLMRMVINALDGPATAANVSKGKIAYGSDFYGLSQYIVDGSFKPSREPKPLGYASLRKAFAIDQDVAQACTNPFWVMLFRDIVLKGTKMRFCCGKTGALNGSEQECCCGGCEWTHNARQNIVK